MGHLGKATILKTNGRILVAAAILLLTLPVASPANMLTWAMDGTIQQVSDSLGIGFAQVGSHVVYTFTFDSDTPNTYLGTNGATYIGDSSALAVDTTLISGGPPRMEIGRHPTFHDNDMFQVVSPIESESIHGAFFFRLMDRLGTGLTDTSLPSQPYDLTQFTDTYFSATVSGYNAPYGTLLTFSGNINSFYVVPEPASFVLLALTILPLTRRRRL